MNDPDRDELWRDLLDDAADPAFAEWSRTQTLAGVRRLRRRRKRLRAGIACVVGCALCYLAAHFTEPSSSPAVARSTPAPVPSESVRTSLPPLRYLTDEELLSRFPNRPVALVGSPEHQQLIFLDDPGVLR